MAIMYFSFTCIGKKGDKDYNPQVDYIAFEDEEGNSASLSCNFESDFGFDFNEPNRYSARFKGVDICRFDATVEEEEHEVTIKDLDTLKGMKPTEIGLYIDESVDFDIEKIVDFEASLSVFDVETKQISEMVCSAEEVAFISV